MSILHLVSVVLTRQPELAAQIDSAVHAHDSVLFIGAGIYSLYSRVEWPERTYVLQADCSASGIHPPEHVVRIDYSGMVTLCEHHERIITWN
ncbi:MAG TPA: DsrH/TusB family sulfur metabolism protein [Fluviicoccus sp.]|nr:DsrH/TusB family sulfur metabolism protein [Fluviicoccus sp.]